MTSPQVGIEMNNSAANHASSVPNENLRVRTKLQMLSKSRVEVNAWKAPSPLLRDSNNIAELLSTLFARQHDLTRFITLPFPGGPECQKSISPARRFRFQSLMMKASGG